MSGRNRGIYCRSKLLITISSAHVMWQLPSDSLLDKRRCIWMLLRCFYGARDAYYNHFAKLWVIFRLGSYRNDLNNILYFSVPPSCTYMSMLYLFWIILLRLPLLYPLVINMANRILLTASLSNWIEQTISQGVLSWRRLLRNRRNVLLCNTILPNFTYL